MRFNNIGRDKVKSGEENKNLILFLYLFKFPSANHSFTLNGRCTGIVLTLLEIEKLRYSNW